MQRLRWRLTRWLVARARMRRACLGQRRNVKGGAGEAIAVAKGGGRGIVGEALGVALVLAWWKKEGWLSGEFWRRRG